MADAQDRLDPVWRADRLLDILRRSHGLELRRSICLMEAERYDDEAASVADQTLDGDIALMVEERARLLRDAAECRKEAARYEKEIHKAMWEVTDVSPREETA